MAYSLHDPDGSKQKAWLEKYNSIYAGYCVTYGDNYVVNWDSETEDYELAAKDELASYQRNQYKYPKETAERIAGFFLRLKKKPVKVFSNEVTPSRYD